MRIEINQLEQFNHLASRGASQAASSLTQLTGLTIRDEMTSVSLVTESALQEIFTGQQYVGVQVGLDGGLSGETVLILEPDSAAQIKQQIPGASAAGSMTGSAFAEIGNIMIGGFVDGWANHLGVTVDITPPTYLEATGTRILPRLTRREAADEGVFLFQSQLEAKDTDLSVPMYLIPEYDEFVSLLAGRSNGPSVPAEKLTIFNDFAEQSANRASEQIAMLTGLATDVDVSQLRFMSLSEMADNIGTETHVGSVFEMDGLPSGYFLLLFDLGSAKSVASAMMPGDGAVDESAMKPAIEELGNILTSGFVDGWANTLKTTIEHSPPEYVRDEGAAVIHDIVDRLDGSQESAFTIDSAIEIGGRETQCRIYVLPDRNELTHALEQIPGP
ncbi:chemotaxis protein CheC [Halohasta salina]|uniref:chemotaxis protein CheC n=1 Tax=Halohasta salina TaxID=2961621 RepID=UPI0020A30D44|nr:chemotaxis protein CheC [Halohasta salina]